MSFFQRLRNGLSRFMYGRNGADQLGLCIIWAAILLDIVSMLVKKVPLLSGIIGLVTTAMVLWRCSGYSRGIWRGAGRRTPPFCRRCGGH